MWTFVFLCTRHRPVVSRTWIVQLHNLPSVSPSISDSLTLSLYLHLPTKSRSQTVKDGNRRWSFTSLSRSVILDSVSVRITLGWRLPAYSNGFWFNWAFRFHFSWIIIQVCSCIWWTDVLGLGIWLLYWFVFGSAAFIVRVVFNSHWCWTEYTEQGWIPNW